MTHYFNDMSFNKLKFIGKTVSVITPHTRAWYLANNKKRGDIHTEIIQQLDQTWDFAEFDNWDYEGNYNHINRPDGIVDMVFMVWRNIANDLQNPDQIYTNLNMGRYGDLGAGWPNILVDNGQRRLKMDFWPNIQTKQPGGSGATLTDWFTENMFRFSIHEFGHYLQGGNDQHVGFGFWGLLSGWGIKSFVANAFERYRLGWINLNTVQASPNQTIQNATLPDFITSGVAYRLIINAATNEYFYIENHQKTSFWENNQMFLRSPYGNVENGIYVLRQDAAGNDDKFIYCLAADGRWNWTVNQIIQNPWGSTPPTLPVFKQLGIDRVNGYHDLQHIPWTWNGVSQGVAAIHFTENKSGQPIEDVRWKGDGKDAFRVGYNEVWSPYSNPNSQRLNKAVTPFGFKINSFNYGVASLDIYVGTSLDGPPSKPQYPRLIGSPKYGWVEVQWDGNLESDVNLYEVSRLIPEYGNSWSVIGTTTNTFFRDTEMLYAPGGGLVTPQYRVRAKDTQNKYSVYSDIVQVRAEPLGKESVLSVEIKDYELATNYPNPFNPSTKISYSIKEEGLVTLKVYDILGKEIATLVNESKPSGKYEAEFNASQLPSGVYFYKLTSGNFVETRKMLLMK